MADPSTSTSALGPPLDRLILTESRRSVPFLAVPPAPAPPCSLDEFEAEPPEVRSIDDVVEFNVPEGESVAPTAGGGRGRRLRSQACLRAELGFILVAGSHSRQRRMKSRNKGSSQPLRAVCSSREPGGPRGLPRRERPPLRTVVPSGSVVAVQYRG